MILTNLNTIKYNNFIISLEILDSVKRIPASSQYRINVEGKNNVICVMTCISSI
jgi:hypothetical protein